MKRLSKTHLIVASGSNYRALRAHGIRVDVVVIMERNMKWNLYAEITRNLETLIHVFFLRYMSRRIYLCVSDAAVFFRPALTPLAVFQIQTRNCLLLKVLNQ